MKKTLKVLKWVIISLLSLAILGAGLIVWLMYLITLPKTTNETSRVDSIRYRVIGAEFDSSKKFRECSATTIYFYVSRYNKGDLGKLAKVINDFEIHERTTRHSSPVVAHLDSLMYCNSFRVAVCKRNVVKYYDCSDRFFLESVRYKRINEDEFCLTSDSGNRECFEFTWTPKERNNPHYR
ncbi:MAG: hypothetical protein EA411_09105 [Saprospirales bacterium]|nr:MAG: hypothetical protein EA411_09105 [Saprospirales bacterium]